MATPQLNLTEMVANQNNAHILYNTMLSYFDFFAQPTIINITTSTPPVSPSNGDAYIPVATATGSWASHENDIAYYYNGWIFFSPAIGWRIYDTDAGAFKEWSGSSWDTLGTSTSLPSGAYLTGYSEVATSVASSSGAITFNLSASNFFYVTLTENITSISFSNIPTSGRVAPIVIEFTQDGTGGRTVSGWPAAVKWPGGSAPTISAGAGEVDLISGYTRNGGTTIRLGRSMEDSS